MTNKKENFIKVRFIKIFFYLSIYFLIIFSFYSEYKGLAECKVSFSIQFSNLQVKPNSYAYEINELLDSKLKNYLRYHKKRLIILLQLLEILLIRFEKITGPIMKLSSKEVINGTFLSLAMTSRATKVKSRKR